MLGVDSDIVVTPMGLFRYLVVLAGLGWRKLQSPARRRHGQRPAFISDTDGCGGRSRNRLGGSAIAVMGPREPRRRQMRHGHDPEPHKTACRFLSRRPLV